MESINEIISKSIDVFIRLTLQSEMYHGIIYAV